MPVATRTLSTPFSYVCGACGKCCFDKRIQVNPYEVLRLARNRGLSTGLFIDRYMEHEGPFLAVRDDGGCVLLDGVGCSVHADRPLACRLYPLGRVVDADGTERFGSIQPHPESAGQWGVNSNVASYLAAQRTAPHMVAADALQAIFYRLFDALNSQNISEGDTEFVPPSTDRPSGEQGRPFYAEWLDVDAVVARHCRRCGVEVPTAIDQVFATYLAAIDAWLSDIQPSEDYNEQDNQGDRGSGPASD